MQQCRGTQLGSTAPGRGDILYLLVCRYHRAYHVLQDNGYHKPRSPLELNMCAFLLASSRIKQRINILQPLLHVVFNLSHARRVGCRPMLSVRQYIGVVVVAPNLHVCVDEPIVVRVQRLDEAMQPFSMLARFLRHCTMAEADTDGPRATGDRLASRA